jgi:hypothetical protein
MNVSEVKDLPLEEKLQIMDSLWEDLQNRYNETKISDSHRRILDERRANSKPLAWDDVKDSTGRA